MERVRLAVDVTGGDFGAAVLVEGLVEARRRGDTAFSACLCGNRDQIESLLHQHGQQSNGRGEWSDGMFTIEHATDTISGEDIPSRTWKSKPGSAIVRCIALQKEGKVDASISAGDTGTLMSAAIFILGRHKHIARPALAALLPTTGNGRTLLVDVGANLNCRPDHLASFALLGERYMRSMYAIETPRVALLNIGTEPTKGTQSIFDAAQVLRRQYRGFRGYIESSRILAGEIDVVVCNGFVGNVLLKALESFYRLTEAVLGAQNPAVRDAINQHMTIFNAENYGAVPFLGINGVVLKAHGGSSVNAFASAVGSAIAAARRGAVLGPDSGTTKGRIHSYAV